MSNKKERNVFTNDMINKTQNAFREFTNFTTSLLSQGLIFEKKVTKFSKTSAAIYLPKRLIGRTFKVFLMPINDGYEVSEPEINEKQADKELKAAEKDLERIHEESKKIDINETKPNFVPIL